MFSTHVQIAEPTALATTDPHGLQGASDVTSAGLTRAWRCVPSTTGAMAPTATHLTRSPDSSSGTLDIGGGLHDRIEVRPA